MMIITTYTAGTAGEASSSKWTKLNDQHESEHVDGLHGILRWLLGEGGDDDFDDDGDQEPGDDWNDDAEDLYLGEGYSNLQYEKRLEICIFAAVLPARPVQEE